MAATAQCFAIGATFSHDKMIAFAVGLAEALELLTIVAFGSTCAPWTLLIAAVATVVGAAAPKIKLRYYASLPLPYKIVVLLIRAIAYLVGRGIAGDTTYYDFPTGAILGLAGLALLFICENAVIPEDEKKKDRERFVGLSIAVAAVYLCTLVCSLLPATTRPSLIGVVAATGSALAVLYVVAVTFSYKNKQRE